MWLNKDNKNSERKEEVEIDKKGWVANKHLWERLKSYMAKKIRKTAWPPK